jgi:hypothetical protein
MPAGNIESPVAARAGGDPSAGAPALSQTPLQLGHIGLTVSRRLLDADERRRIVDFFSTCFGFEERPEHSRDGEFLVMALGGIDRFIILFADDSPIGVGNWRQDHCAFVCGSLEEFDARARIARAYAAEEPACKFEDYSVEEIASSAPGYRVHKLYLQPAGLPLAFELQYWERSPRLGGEPHA